MAPSPLDALTAATQPEPTGRREHPPHRSLTQAEPPRCRSLRVQKRGRQHTFPSASRRSPRPGRHPRPGPAQSGSGPRSKARSRRRFRRADSSGPGGTAGRGVSTAIPGDMTGGYPMLRACAVRTAAIVTCRSASRVPPPDTAVNASTNLGCQAATSSSTSDRSTPRQHGLQPLAQIDQARWVWEAFNVLHMQLAVVDGDGGVHHQPAADLAVGDIQQPCMPQPAADPDPRAARASSTRPDRRHPRRPVEQLGPRITPPGRRRRVHIATQQRPMEPLPYTELPARLVDHAVRQPRRCTSRRRSPPSRSASITVRDLSASQLA